LIQLAPEARPGNARVVAERQRDLTWDAVCEFADRINASGRAHELNVKAQRRRHWVVITVEGLWVGNRWTDVFEPVRSRRTGAGRWKDLQSVSEAAAKIGAFLDRRPDLDDTSSASFRDLTNSERELLDGLLAHDFSGADDLRQQVAIARVRSGCHCGCGTLEFEKDLEGEPPDPAAVERPVDLEGVVLNAQGSPVGGLLLFVRQGHLSSLEVYSTAGEPLPLPSPDRVDWVAVPRS